MARVPGPDNLDWVGAFTRTMKERTRPKRRYSAATTPRALVVSTAPRYDDQEPASERAATRGSRNRTENRDRELGSRTRIYEQKSIRKTYTTRSSRRFVHS